MRIIGKFYAECVYPEAYDDLQLIDITIYLSSVGSQFRIVG